jgi:hypothetical protein
MMVRAQGTTLNNPIHSTSLYCFLNMVLSALIYILFPILTLVVTYIGYLFVSAQGNERKLEEAKRWIIWAVVGGVILLGAKALSMAIENTVSNILLQSGLGAGGGASGGVCP